MKRYSIFFAPLLIIAGVLGFWFYNLSQNANSTSNEKAVGAVSPDALNYSGHIQKNFTLQRLARTKLLMPNLKGRPVMINFWASWCAPCMSEMPSIYKLREKYENQGFEVVAINLDLDVLKGVEYLGKRFGEPKFIVVPGNDTKYPEMFEVEGVPFTVLVDRKGNIRYAETGERDWLDHQSIQLVEGIL